MLLTYIENKRLIREEYSGKFDRECDILVVGLGTAGALAAICAAESGLHTIGVEKATAMGGMGTLACVWDYYYGSSGGEYEDIDRRSLEVTENEHYLPVGNPKICINGAVKQQLMESDAVRNGCRLIYDASVCGVFVGDGEKVCGVRVFHDGSFVDIGAKVVIDSTGNATVCRFAGCEFNSGRKFDNIHMNASKPTVALRRGCARGEWGMGGRIDGVSPDDVTKAITNGIVTGILARQHFTSDGRALFDGALLGVRESPNIIADEIYTLGDYRRGKPQKDVLMYACAPLDCTNRDTAFEDDESQNYRVLCNLADYGFSLGVSRDMMLPRGKEGIIVACRAVGVDHTLAGMLRMKKDMQKMGEAAAVLASESIKQGKTLRETDLAPVIKHLSETGCYDKANDMGLCFLEKQYIYTPRELAANKAELEKAFESDEPGLGVWSYISGNAMVSDSEMTELLGAAKKNVRYGAALCLGIMGHHEALPVIREMFADTYPLANVPGKVSSPWASFYPSDIQAIILLGRFADKESAEALLEIVRDGGRKKAAYFTEREIKHSVAKPVQYFEYAAKAVLDIAERLDDDALKSELKYALSSSVILKDSEYTDSIKEFEGKL